MACSVLHPHAYGYRNMQTSHLSRVHYSRTLLYKTLIIGMQTLQHTLAKYQALFHSFNMLRVPAAESSALS